MYQRMLVPSDGSELAEVAFTYAKELAGRLDLEVILLHVGDLGRHEFTPMHRAHVERAAEVIKRQSRAIQKKTGVQPGGKRVEVKGELVKGYAAEEILRYVDDNAVDLILMATHGRSGLSRWVYGSVAENVLRGVSSPILLVRPH